MECRHCKARLEAVFDNGVIDHYKFICPMPGCCCEVDIVECQSCGWIGSPENLIAPWSDWDPGCPSCLNNDFLDVEEIEKEVICQKQQ